MFRSRLRSTQILLLMTTDIVGIGPSSVRECQSLHVALEDAGVDIIRHVYRESRNKVIHTYT